MGIILENKVIQNSKLWKNFINEKCSPKLIFFNEQKLERDSNDFWHRKFTLKVQNWHFLTNFLQMETQNLVVSFDYSWFLAKNLAYAECRIMKFHYQNSSTSQRNLKFSKTSKHGKVSSSTDYVACMYRFYPDNQREFCKIELP